MDKLGYNENMMKKEEFTLTICLFLIPLLFSGCQHQLKGKALIEAAHKEGGVLYTYGMADSWGSYRPLFSAFEKKYGIKHYDIDMSSGDVADRLEREKDEPAIDTGVVGIHYAYQSRIKELVRGYYSPEAKNLPPWAVDPDNPRFPTWYATYYGTLGFMVNLDVVKEVPKTWQDLLKPIYKGKIGYIDPRVSATGFATVLSAAYANGGSIENIEPGVEFFKRLHKLGNIWAMQGRQDFLQFASGVVPILINYDYNLLSQKYKMGVNAAVVIPTDGSVRYSYINLIVKDSPHPYTTQLFLDFFLSREGQTILAQGFVQPVREDIELPFEVKKRLLPKEAYQNVHDVDWRQAKSAQAQIKKTWEQVVLGK